MMGMHCYVIEIMFWYIFIALTAWALKTKDTKLTQIFNSRVLLYRWCSVTEQFSNRWLSASHLYKRAWSKGYY